MIWSRTNQCRTWPIGRTCDIALVLEPVENETKTKTGWHVSISTVLGHRISNYEAQGIVAQGEFPIMFLSQVKASLQKDDVACSSRLNWDAWHTPSLWMVGSTDINKEMTSNKGGWPLGSHRVPLEFLTWLHHYLLTTEWSSVPLSRWSLVIFNEWYS